MARALSFKIGKIPVVVHPWFFILTLVLGANEPSLLPAWVAIVFVSVVVHELGHATLGMAFGLEPSIELHGMGGTTSWVAVKPLSTAQRVAISLAGPFAGFVVGGAVYAAAAAGLFPKTALWLAILKQVLFVNVGWGIFNLLPILPLDGGNVMATVLDALTKGRGKRPSYVSSIVLAALVGVGVMLGQLGWWGLWLVFSFIAVNYRGLQELRARDNDEPLRESLRLAYEALDAKDAERVLALARPVALSSKTAQVRAEALQLLAFGFLLEGRVADADAALAALPEGYEPHPRLVAQRAAAVTAHPSEA